MNLKGESNGFKLLMKHDELSSGLVMPSEFASRMPMNLEYLIGVMVTSASIHYGVKGGFSVIALAWKKESREQDIAEAVDQCIRSITNETVPSS
jgi:hypothetical protein